MLYFFLMSGKSATKDKTLGGCQKYVEGGGTAHLVVHPVCKSESLLFGSWCVLGSHQMSANVYLMVNKVLLAL